MALSDREKKVLEELERGLFADDEEFAKRVQGAKSHSSSTSASKKSGKSSPPAARLVGGTLLAIVGLSVLLLAAIVQYIIIGVVGFVIMLTGLVIASSNWSNTSLNQKRSGAKGKPSSSKGFFEDRWDRRINGDN